MMKQILFFFSLFTLSQIEGHGNHHHHCENCHEEFTWTKEKSDFAQIGLQIASEGHIQNYIQVSGKVLPHPDHIAYVVPKVHGVVTEIRKNVGEFVEKNEVIATVESTELAEAKSIYLVALKRSRLQHALLKKEEALKGISSGNDYLNARFAYEEAVLQKDLAQQHLYVLGLTESEIGAIEHEGPRLVRFYAIRAPLQGKVLQRSLTLGELIDDEARVFTIANFDKVWIEMNIPQKDVHHLASGLPIDLLGVNGKKTTLNLAQFNPMICEQTRTATAIAILDNQEGQWSPGEFVTASIQTDQTSVSCIVPREALLSIKGSQYIFVQQDDQLTPSIVKTGKGDGKNVEILSGLKVGEAYAASNTFCLKAEFEKEEAEHHH